jgi:xanthine dehydrogenase YagR molybdenum-binding subunit
LKNYAESDPESGKPWSSNSLRECYRVGADRFGWSRRTPTPRSMRDGDVLVGWGMAMATRPSRRMPASALARIFPDGHALVQAATHELGTGTYTVMTQVAADALGMAPERVRFELGDTNLPENPISAGSMTVPSSGSAVHLAATAARDRAIQLAIADERSPLHGVRAENVRVENGRLSLARDPSRGESYEALLVRNGGQPVEARVDAKPGDEAERFSIHAFGAVFAEVRVDPDLGEIRVSRLVGAYAPGRVLNAKTARSQLMGGIVWGLGMALMEHTLPDPRTGRYVNADLAEYHVPVNADVPNIDIVIVDEHDPYVNPIGAKGLGEISMTGVAAAVANAVYHATGVRVRDLPITLDKLLVRRA